MKETFLEQYYIIDRNTGDYIIQISLKDYDDVFNTWDSSVYNIRDLDSSLKSFLEEFLYEIDQRKNIVLNFQMNNQNKDVKMENNIETGIRNYFNYCYYLETKKIKNSRKRIVSYILVSFLLTTLSFYLQVLDENGLVHEIVSLNFTVGGWVFLWEAFSLLFMQSSGLRKKKKHYKRISDAFIKFSYK